MFQRAAGVKFQHVPYKGAAQAITDLMGERVDVFMSSVPTLLSHIRNGNFRAIAISSAKRSASLPYVPAIAEAGYAGFDATTWFGLVAPAKTPQSVIVRLNAETNRVLKLPEVREKIAFEGGEPMGGTPEDFSRLLRVDHAKWAETIKAAGVRID
jgi:tripartite-type tricarboxylate transporter receptor subunit TctC